MRVSIGNLSLDAIDSKMKKVMKSFDFESIEKAIKELI